MLWLPIVGGLLWLGKIPPSYPVKQAHKLLLLLPLYVMAPVAVEIYRRFWDRCFWSDYGVVWHGRFLQTAGWGFAIAVLGVAVLLGGQWALGWQQRTPTDHWATAPVDWLTLLALLPLTAFIGWVEELIFRGVLVNGLLATLPWGAMAMVASLIFALSHLVWDGPAGVPQLPGLVLMGLVLLLARWVAGGSLGLAWGLHTGWIFAIALSDTLNLTQPSSNAPAWLAGRPEQPLTGLAALALLLLTGAGIWGYTLWAGASLG